MSELYFYNNPKLNFLLSTCELFQRIKSPENELKINRIV